MPPETDSSLVPIEGIQEDRSSTTLKPDSYSSLVRSKEEQEPEEEVQIVIPSIDTLEITLKHDQQVEPDRSESDHEIEAGQKQLEPSPGQSHLDVLKEADES